MITRSLIALLPMLMTGSAAFAETPPADGNLSFGNRLTVATLVSALQASGYQALAAAPQPITPPPGAAPVVNPAISVITTGIGGSKVMLVVNRCPNVTNDEICTIAFVASFTDNKNLINDASLAVLNQRTSIAKVIPQKKGDAVTGFAVIYNYICKGLDDPKFVSPVLATFGADIGQVGNAYNTVLTAPVAKP